MRNLQGFINRGGVEDDKKKGSSNWIQRVNVQNIPELESMEEDMLLLVKT